MDLDVFLDSIETTPEYVDMDGNAIDVETWGRLYGDFEGRILAVTPFWRGGCACQVITVWTGFQSRLCDQRAFGTALRIGYAIQELEQYDTKREAYAGHVRAVSRQLTAGLADDRTWPTGGQTTT